MKRITKEQYNQELLLAMRSIKEGRGIKHADVLKKLNKMAKHTNSKTNSSDSDK